MRNFSLCCAFLFLLPILRAQPRRISSAIDNNRRTIVKGSRHPLARSEFDSGPVDPSRMIGPMIIGFNRSAAQRSALSKLLDDQRNPASSRYHRWLTPEQYADAYGMSQEDLRAVDQWLTSQGFVVDHHARGRNWIGFRGTAAQVNRAFSTELHRYKVGGEEHFANASEISLPAALAAVTDAILGLDDFHPKPHYTSATGTHSLAPDDLATIYDIMPLYNSGFDGTGIKIAVLGESQLEANFSDIHAFQTQFNLPLVNPKVLLYGVNPGINGAVTEGDLDVEWTSAIARKASLIYVYSSDAEAARIYAVDQNVAPIITASYGTCETQRAYLSVMLQSIAQQANAQGITIVNASGDAGPAACDDAFHEPSAVNGPYVQFPASIPEITAVGGTEFNESSATDRNSSNTSNGASATGYIPEKGWNDTASLGAIAASTGGPSVLFAKPAWQSGPGVPNDGRRDTPDVALSASALHDGYMVCSERTCYNAGGTSASAPVFAGIVALLNQSLVSRGVLSQPGLGNINPLLYQLAASGSTAFHDITAGDNIVPCVIGTSGCATGTLGYMAGPGYDLVTGLGSIDAMNLVNAWNIGATQTALAVSADKTSATLSDSIYLTITVSGAGIAPTGTVVANQSGTPIPYGTQPGDVLLGSASLAPSGNGASSTATLIIYPGQLTAGSDTITVTYGGDSNFNGSAASIPVTIAVPAGHSAVGVAAFDNYWEYQYPPIFYNLADSSGYGWVFALRLTSSPASPPL